MNQYNWKEINFPAQPLKDWKMFELSNKSIALNVLYIPHNTEKIRLAYKSKHNFKLKNQVILLMITDGKKWYYPAVKSLSALLRGTTSKHNGDFYCINCFHSYSTKEKFKKHEKVCNDHDCCYIEMPNEDNKILKYNHGEKSLKVPAIIYADLECLLEKIHSCQNNSEKSSTEKKVKHTPSGYSIFTSCSFNPTRNNLDYYREEDCMEKFCKDLRENAVQIINYEKKEMIPLTDKKQKVCHICKKKVKLVLIKTIKIHLNYTIK